MSGSGEGGVARWRRGGCLLALGILWSLSVPAHAGAVDDYEAGAKAYAAEDVVSAMAKLKRAADSGHAAAQALLGDILHQAEFNEDAVAYFRKSAEQGNADGQYGLGVMYVSGEGVKRDVALARKWIELAAAQGHKQAINVYAQAYIAAELGLDETARRSAEALTWIKRAADNDYIPAIEALAAAYRTGDLGLTADPKMADELTAKAEKLRGLVKDVTKKKKK